MSGAGLREYQEGRGEERERGVSNEVDLESLERIRTVETVSVI